MDNVKAKLSSGKTVELHPISAREQLDADLCSGADGTALEYYRTVIALSKIDDAVLLPATSKLNLDALIDRFEGFEIDEMRNVYRLNFVPFLATIGEKNLDDVLFTEAREGAFKNIVDALVTKSEDSGNYTVQLSSGRPAEVRVLTARQQMKADSWSQGDPVVRGYYRTIMALAKLGDESLPVPSDQKDVESTINRLSGMDVDELGTVYGLKFSSRAEVLKNEPSPRSSGS